MEEPMPGVKASKLRITVFMNWATYMLKQHACPTVVEDLHDFKTAVVLIRLVEIVGRASCKDNVYVEPVDRMQCVQNAHTFILFATSCGIVIHLLPEDIVSCKESDVYDLLWLLARRYYCCTIRGEEAYSPPALLDYLNTRASQYLRGFTEIQRTAVGPSWQDGLALCGLVAAQNMDVFSFDDALEMMPTERVALALGQAEALYGVPALVPSSVALPKECLALYLCVFFSICQDPLDMKEEELRALRSDYESSQRELMSTKSKNQTHASIIARLTENKLEDETHINKLLAVNSTLAERVGDMSMERDDLRAELAACRDEVSKMKGSTEQSIAQALAEMAEIKASYSAVRKELDSTIQQNIVVNKQLSSLLRQAKFRSADQSGLDIKEVSPPTGSVAVMFTSIVDSGKLWEADADVMEHCLRAHNAVIRANLAKFEGYEVKAEGDAFVAVFHLCDDAVKCALEAQEALVRSAWPEGLLKNSDVARTVHAANGSTVLFRGPRVRIGINFGVPTMTMDPSSNKPDYVGPLINRCAKIMHAAQGGQVLISDSVWLEVEDNLEILGNPLVRDMGAQSLPGLTQEVYLHEILPRSLPRKFENAIAMSDTVDTPARLWTEAAALQRTNDSLLVHAQGLSEQFHEVKMNASSIASQLDFLEEKIHGTEDVSAALKDARHEIKQLQIALTKEIATRKELTAEMGEIKEYQTNVQEQIRRQRHTGNKMAGYVDKVMDQHRASTEQKTAEHDLRGQLTESLAETKALKEKMEEMEKRHRIMMFNMQFPSEGQLMPRLPRRRKRKSRGNETKAAEDVPGRAEARDSPGLEELSSSPHRRLKRTSEDFLSPSVDAKRGRSSSQGTSDEGSSRDGEERLPRKKRLPELRASRSGTFEQPTDEDEFYNKYGRSPPKERPRNRHGAIYNSMVLPLVRPPTEGSPREKGPDRSLSPGRSPDRARNFPVPRRRISRSDAEAKKDKKHTLRTGPPSRKRSSQAVPALTWQDNIEVQLLRHGILTAMRVASSCKAESSKNRYEDDEVPEPLTSALTSMNNFGRAATRMVLMPECVERIVGNIVYEDFFLTGVLSRPEVETITRATLKGYAAACQATPKPGGSSHLLKILPPWPHP